MYGNPKGDLQVLRAITDVTLARAEARKKDDLIREKAILLQEVQRRVADSLQIIAGVLLQSARRAQSEEARGHLRNAHHRVMSIAAVQRYLALSALRDVALHRNFIQLCESLRASMIHDPERLSIVVTVDDSVVDANVSLNLGLIITELCKNYVILVVEDIPLIRMGAVDLLVDAGFEVLEAGSADEAISILEARPDTHLVFTDVGMAGAMDGIKLSHYIRSRWPASGKTVDESHLPDLEKKPEKRLVGYARVRRSSKTLHGSGRRRR
jgi:hypothetical protein